MLNKNKIVINFVAGLVSSIGMAVGREGYKVFEAVDPLYDLRVKLSENKRKRQFDYIMSQTNLKGDLG